MLDEEDDDLSFDLPESLYSFMMKINGIDTQVHVNRCGIGTDQPFLAVNLMRGDEYVNSYTMKFVAEPISKEWIWLFAEEYVPKELKKLEGVISDAVMEHK